MTAHQMMVDEFLAAMRVDDVHADALFAPMRVGWPKWDVHNNVLCEQKSRHQKLHECMIESLDYGDGPTTADLMQLLCKVANGEIQTAQARELRQRMAEAFAKYNSEEDER